MSPPAASTTAENASHAARRTKRGDAPRDARMPYRVPCRVRLVDVGTGEVRTVIGQTVNISNTGLGIQLPVAAPIGTWVETLVINPAGDPMFLCGHVAHLRRSLSSTFEIGVRMAREGQRLIL